MTVKEYYKNDTYKNDTYKLNSHLTLDSTITDLNGIEKFTRLIGLDISKSGITNISKLEYLPKIEQIQIHNNLIDISVIPKLKRLKFLTLVAYTKDMDIMDLTHIKNSEIEVLFLNYAYIKNLDFILYMKKLRKIHLRNYWDKDFSKFMKLYHIENENLDDLKKLIITKRRERIIAEFIK